MQRVLPVEIKNVSFTYGCHPVLEDISLSITQGEVAGITGPNGSGKTTLVKLLVGLIQPQSGEIRMFGHDVWGKDWRKKISYVAQNATFFNEGFPATVMEVVLSGRTARKGLFRGFGPRDYEAAGDALELMEIYPLRDKPISCLSGGQQQRAFIARALAAEPELLIMDEPTVGVDPSASQKLYRILRKINQEQNLTLVIVSHDLEGIAGLITRQVCLGQHLCTCNSWDESTDSALSGPCNSVFSLYPAGRI